MLRRALELEKEIARVQKSTRTSCRFFVPIHNWLRMKLRFYYSWSAEPFSNLIHWAVLVLFILSSVPAFMGLNSRPDQSAAAGLAYSENFSTSNFMDFTKTTGKWDIKNHMAQTGYKEEPKDLGSAAIIPAEYSLNLTSLYPIFVPANQAKSAKDTIYYFGARNAQNQNVVLKFFSDEDTFQLLSSTDVNFPPADLTLDLYGSRITNDFDNNRALILKDNKVFNFNFTDETFAASVPTPQGSRSDSSYSNLYGMIPVHVPSASSIQEFKGKTLFIGGDQHVGSQTYGSSSSYIFDSAANSFGPTTYEIPFPAGWSAKNVNGGTGTYYQKNGNEHIYLFGANRCSNNSAVNGNGNGNTNGIGLNNLIGKAIASGGRDANCLSDMTGFETGPYNQFLDYNLTAGLLSESSISSSLTYSSYSPVGGTISPSNQYYFNNTNHTITKYAFETDSVGTGMAYNSLLTLKAPVFDRNNKLYLIDQNRQIHIYSTLNDAFEGGGNFDSANKSGFAQIQNGSKGYVMGGPDTDPDSPYIYTFDMVTQDLIKTAKTLSPNLSSPIGTYLNGTYYLFGGQVGGSNVDTIYTSANPEGDDPNQAGQTFTLSDTHLPFGIGFGFAAAVSDKIYIFARKTDASKYTVIEFNPADPASTHEIANNDSEPLLYRLVVRGGAAAANGRIYFTTSSVSLQSKKIASFDPTSGAFAELSSISSPLGFNCPIIRDDSSGMLYAFGLGATGKNIYSVSQTNAISLLGAESIYALNSTNVAAFNFNGKIYLISGRSIEELDLNLDSNKNIIQSTKINSGSGAPIYKASFSAQYSAPSGTSVTFQLSSDGGTTWVDASNNSTVQFANRSKMKIFDRAVAASGSDLRWRATIEGTGTETPVINSVNISYYGVQSSLYFSLPGASFLTKNAGEPTGEIKVGLKDLAGNSTVPDRDITLALSSTDSNKARFSSSADGPWSQTLTLSIRKDQEFASFYYLNFDANTHAIKAHSSDGLGDAIASIITNPGPYNASFSYSPALLTVGNNSTISANITYNGIPAEGKTATFYSSTGKDSITQPSGAVDANGNISAGISSTVSGDKTITLRVNEDNVFIEAPNQITFTPSSVASVVVNSTPAGTVNAGGNLSVTASLFDRFHNLATNTNDGITLFSTDQFFVPINHKITPKENGVVSFTGLALKSSGRQTLTVRDNNTDISGSTEIIVLADNPFASSSKIFSDKTRILLNSDKAAITVKIADQYGNGVPGIPVHIKKALSYGDLDKYDSVTNSSGEAVFVYTPSKVGKEDFHAYTDNFAIANTLTIEIAPDNLVNQIGSIVDTLQNNSIAKAIAKAANAVVATAATLGLIPMIAGVISSAPAAAHAVTYAFSLGMEAIGAKKRRRSWGRVFDSTSGRGLDMATVRLFDQASMKLVSTVVTDIKGHFSFQPQPGSYIISVIKDKYVFPTSIFAKYGIATIDKSASRINSHYVGQTVNVTSESNLINLDIPVDPHNKKPTLIIRAKVFLSDFFEMVTSGLSYIFIPSLVLGSVISIFAAIVLPTTRNISICLVYILVVLFYVLSHFIKVRKFSIVYNSKTRKPVNAAVVSVFDKEYNTLKETRITDKFGRFSIQVPRGAYRLKVEKEGYQFPSTKINRHRISNRRFTNLYFGDIMSINKEEFINVSVPVDEERKTKEN